MFFYLVAADLVGNLVGAPATFYLMKYGPWTATAVGYSLYISRFLVLVFLCQDLRRDKYANDDERLFREDADKGAAAAAFSTIRNPLHVIRQTYHACVKIFSANRKLGILLTTLLFSDLSKYANILFNQYVAKRFDWSWSQVRSNLLNSSYQQLPPNNHRPISSAPSRPLPVSRS